MADNQHWVGSWTMAPAPAETGAFTNQTLRMTMRLSLGGNQVRVRISNAYGRRHRPAAHPMLIVCHRAFPPSMPNSEIGQAYYPTAPTVPQ